MVCAMRHQTSWYRDLKDRNYPRSNIPTLLRYNLVILTYRMCSPFRSRGRGGNRELKKGNSVRKLTCSNFWDSRCSRARTNLFLITFLLFRGRRGLRRYFSRVLSSRDTSGGVSDSMMSVWASSRINIFASFRTGMRLCWVSLETYQY